MKGVVLVLIALLAVPAVVALDANVPYCRTRSDCIRLMATADLSCEKGFVRAYSPDCVLGKCQFCRSIQRPSVDCRFDVDCAKKKCPQPYFKQCTGSKCVCSAQARPECYTDQDCRRVFFLTLRHQRRVCEHSKCVTPTPVVTMLPRYNTPKY